ncbi:MAG TPA: LytR C-terminal domain-containing protein [Solirubrobacteraceae bacterium]|nr:LytR C-terminal domain-containing protein [Solirubrobacteraceae bacterium]
MTALTFALSLSSSFTKVGAIAAFVALVGIAILSLLVFSQAREIKRLREWAGRAPERAAEMEQRVSAGASARVQRGSAPATSQGRVVPRTTPLVSAPVATAVGASAAAVKPTAVTPATEAPVAEASVPVTDTSVQAKPEEPAPSAQLSTPPAEVPEATPAAAVASAEPKEEKSATPPAPVTAAAQGATRAVPRSPLPPSPAAPEPAAPRSGSIAAAQASSSRVVNSLPRAAAGAVGIGAASRAAEPVSGGRKDFRQKRSPTRAIVLGVGVLIVVVLVLIFAVSALKGGGSSTPTTAQNTSASQTASSTTTHSTTTHKASQSAVATNPAETSVVVLNGTATTGLAHHLAADLQQSGYTRALASAAVPPGTHQSTVIEYSSGHRADAQGVARTLNVTQVQPMDSTISGLASSATVVVLAGADQAAQLGGGGAQSQGEPAVGQ